MNFRPELAAAVIEGRKTVTRRIARDNPRSTWSRGGCKLAPGQSVAICPGRGKPAVGRRRVASVELMPLGWLSDEEARREGCADAAAFEALWVEINGAYDPDVEVWRVAFEREGVRHGG